MRVGLRDIRSDYEGFARLTKLAGQIEGTVFEQIAVDMGGAGWFDANMSAPLGAILHRASRSLNEVVVENVQPKVHAILSKNGFLPAYGGASLADTWGTTVRYEQFEPEDDRYFAKYAQDHLKGKRISEMTPALRKKSLESIFEIFSNAVIHSRIRSPEQSSMSRSTRPTRTPIV